MNLFSLLTGTRCIRQHNLPYMAFIIYLYIINANNYNTKYTTTLKIALLSIAISINACALIVPLIQPPKMAINMLCNLF